MSFDWLDYLDLAEELAGQGKAVSSQESRLRSAVSRAYYAAFCKARNRLRDQEKLTMPPFDVHKYVWNQFKGSSARVRKEIGMNGDRLKKDRVKVDYDDTIPNVASLTVKALRLSSQIINRLDRL